MQKVICPILSTLNKLDPAPPYLFWDWQGSLISMYRDMIQSNLRTPLSFASPASILHHPPSMVMKMQQQQLLLLIIFFLDFYFLMTKEDLLPRQHDAFSLHGATCY